MRIYQQAYSQSEESLLMMTPLASPPFPSEYEIAAVVLLLTGMSLYGGFRLIKGEIPDRLLQGLTALATVIFALLLFSLFIRFTISGGFG